MMRFVFAALHLSCMKATLLCSASILPPSADPRIGNAYRDSLTLLGSIKLELSCLSQQDCGVGFLCMQPIGEAICEEDCNGICIPKDRRDRICNCDDPCEDGTCINPLLTTEVDNGLCLANDLAGGFRSIKCPGSPGEPNKPGEPENDEASDGTGGSGEAEKEGASDGSAGSGESNDDEDPSVGTEPEVSPSEPESAASDSVDSDSDESPSENGSAPIDNESSSDDSATDSDESPTDSESATEAVCIGADMLDEYESHQLVFPKHVLAHVLCDAFGSCATGGHIVEYEGRGMMMRSYCGIVGCSEKVMYVNSPKYQGALRVRSRSAGMEFTSFAARYGTRGEEAVLRTVVKMGF